MTFASWFVVTLRFHSCFCYFRGSAIRSCWWIQGVYRYTETQMHWNTQVVAGRVWIDRYYIPLIQSTKLYVQYWCPTASVNSTGLIENVLILPHKARLSCHECLHAQWTIMCQRSSLAHSYYITHFSVALFVKTPLRTFTWWLKCSPRGFNGWL